MEERRYHGLDALRGLMMMLGIVLHAALLYLTSPPPAAPIPTDRNNAVVFDWIFEFIHDFRMPTFFVLAGFFTALLVEKRGVGGTLKNRASRILLPLIAALVVILPPTGLLTLDFMLSARFGTHDLIPDRAQLNLLVAEMAVKTGEPPGRLPIGHLWFLYYLCMFYLLIGPLRWLVARCRCLGDARRNGWLARALASPYMLLAFAAWTALTLWPFKGGQVHEGFVYFMPHPPSLLYYGSFFALGYVFHVRREFLDASVLHLRTFALLAVILLPLAGGLSGLDNSARGTSAELHSYAVLANALCTWTLIYTAIGVALRYFDRPSPWIDYTAQSAYWVYLIHMPLVSLAGWWLVQYDLHAVFKFLLVCLFTSTIAFLTFHYGVQKSWLSDFLHGRRFDLRWPWAAKTP